MNQELEDLKNYQFRRWADAVEIPNTMNIRDAVIRDTNRRFAQQDLDAIFGNSFGSCRQYRPAPERKSNKTKLQEAIKWLGDRWVCHPSRHVKRIKEFGK